jgi:hypothetical protein
LVKSCPPQEITGIWQPVGVIENEESAFAKPFGGMVNTAHPHVIVDVAIHDDEVKLII